MGLAGRRASRQGTPATVTDDDASAGNGQDRARGSQIRRRKGAPRRGGTTGPWQGKIQSRGRDRERAGVRARGGEATWPWPAGGRRGRSRGGDGVGLGTCCEDEGEDGPWRSRRGNRAMRLGGEPPGPARRGGRHGAGELVLERLKMARRRSLSRSCSASGVVLLDAHEELLRRRRYYREQRERIG